ncbi:Bug family tripartite tricarboxylate transporter substrate binding protein [Leucothrix mucor]|uniref:Bug family tripartite tricarboxylate transporter substrate binding protein n=1 Tax=Leucothrix mucor TaxID=45248 RepID=UPI0003B3C622|nr:tricarboxylate transporter [Leucothrix mucor]
MKQVNFVRRTLLKAVLGAMALGSVSVSMAEVNFEGKIIDFVIPFSEGGGSDKWARFYAPLLAEQLPGKPTVVVKNMPGAGSTKGANWFASRAKNDGLTILGTSGSTQFPYLLDDRRVKFDYADWKVVLASSTGGVAYLPADLAAKWEKDPKSILDTNFIFGSQGATRLDLIPLLAWSMLGMKVDPVFGIKGRGDGRLMFERGEANIDYQTSSAFLSKVSPLVEEGKAFPIMTWGALNVKGEIVRDPTFPDVPTFKEVYTQIKGEEPSGEAWDAWKAFFVAGFPAQKMVFLPKDTDQEIVDAYAAAFKAVIGQPDFRKKSEQLLGVYEQATGDDAREFKKQGTEVTPETKAWIKSWLKERYGIKL